jgi:predicted Rossmann fold nucleotide-binding protein DprA/Smf involved in DNA uptake
MNRNEVEGVSALQFVLLLHSVPELGEKTLARLLHLSAQRRLVPEECLDLTADAWRRRYGLRPQAAAYLCAHRAELLARSAELARVARSQPLHVLTLESAAYPRRLERYDDAPPPILYGLGRLSLLDRQANGSETQFTFTIALSNDAPPPALARQEEVAATLVQAGGIPVTGHDRVPYQRLALTAQRQDRSVIYIFDRGLREALGPDFDRPPFAAARIREAVFVPERDLALSSFRLDDHGLGANNRRRDRLIFALADIIIAVDVRAGGGMAQECRRALEQGRPVYVTEGGRDGNAALRRAGCPPLPASLEQGIPFSLPGF